MKRRSFQKKSQEFFGMKNSHMGCLLLLNKSFNYMFVVGIVETSIPLVMRRISITSLCFRENDEDSSEYLFEK